MEKIDRPFDLTEAQDETDWPDHFADGFRARLHSDGGQCLPHTSAIGKDGKPLAGAALNSFMTKCTRDACEPKAVGTDGKPLAGAAKTSFMKKCQSEA
jgi:hypothetical protein